MNYEFLDKSIDRENIFLPNSDKINSHLLRNNYADILKAIDFVASEESFLYIHGFMGTGKRQFVNYLCEFLNKDVIKLEYYCKEATVCDDILLSFIEIIENHAISRAVNLNAKISTLSSKFAQQILSIKKPFLIILHSLDDVLPENIELIQDCFSKIIKEENVKIVVTTRGMNVSVLGDAQEDRKIFLKAFTKEVFKDFLIDSNIEGSARIYEDFYKLTRGYYYYVALTVKVLQALNITLVEFMQKHKQSELSFDAFLGMTYINLIPNAIRNFFWFLKTVRHGLSLNALAVYELYDEFSLEYLKNNLMIFQCDEIVYVQDYFLQKIETSIPEKTLIKLHKFIINMYEKQLKESLKNRVINISRQALRAEIEYHNACIVSIKNPQEPVEQPKVQEEQVIEQPHEAKIETAVDLIKIAQNLYADKKYTDAIEKFLGILELEDLDLTSLIEVRSNLAKLYKQIGDYPKANHYYELLETYYNQHNELINLNYLYYDMTDLYYKMYKNERAIETIKKVIYSVDTPQSLMVASCTLLGNIYSDINNPGEAFVYYQKALESLDENVETETLAELYFKYALANDDKEQIETALEFYTKCIALGETSYSALAYSNMASCYFENESYDDARSCFQKAYDLEKSKNNYDGVYYNSFKIAQIYLKENSKKALDYLIEAKKSAEFVNEEFYIMDTTLALGDYYYSQPSSYKDALREYFKAKKIAERLYETVEIHKIERRINDMKLRMKKEDFEEIENKYGR